MSSTLSFFLLLAITSIGVLGQNNTITDPTTEPPTQPPSNSNTTTSNATTSSPTTDTPTTPSPTTQSPTTFASTFASTTPSPTPPATMIITVCGNTCCNTSTHIFTNTDLQQCVEWMNGTLDIHCQNNGMYSVQLWAVHNATTLKTCSSMTSNMMGTASGPADNSCQSINTTSYGIQYFKVICPAVPPPATIISCPPLLARSNQRFTYNISVPSLPQLNFSSSHAIINITCDLGYVVVGDPFVTCDGNTWSTLPYCLLPGYCPPLSGLHRLYQTPSITHVSSLPAQPNNAVINVFCETGYYIDPDINNNARQIKCKGNTYQPALPPCQQVVPVLQCPLFVPPPHTIIKFPSGLSVYPKSYDIGTVIISSCAPDYTSIYNPQSITCVNVTGVGQWSGTGLKTCKSTICPSLSPPPHGQFNSPLPSKMIAGVTLRVSCDVGYRVASSNTGDNANLLCKQPYGVDATWDKAMPVCDPCPDCPTPPPTLSSDAYAKRVAGGVVGGILGFALVITCLYCLCAHHERMGRWMSLGEHEEKVTGEEMTQVTSNMENAGQI